MRYNMTEQQIADELGVSQQTVNNTLGRAMTKLINGLSDRGWSENDIRMWLDTDTFAQTLTEVVDDE